MKLKNVKLHNIFQYSDLEIRFSGNLVGIVGRNGSGKSNFLNALHFAFAGEVPGKTKEQCLKWGEESGYARVEFEHEGRDGWIERHVPGTRASMQLGDEKFTGIKSVNAAVLDKLQMDKDVFRLVFVKQAELDSVLFDQAARREVNFQRMCGLGDANRMYKNLGDLISTVFRENAGDLEATIAALSGERESVVQEIGKCGNSIAELTAKLDSATPFETLQADKRRQERAIQLLQGIQANKSLLAPQQQALSDCKYELNTIGHVEPDDIVKRAAEELANMESTLANWENVDRARNDRMNNIAAARTTMASVEAESKEYADVQQLEAMVETESRAVAEGRAMAGLYSAAVEAFKTLTVPVCPLCGSQMQPGLAASFAGKLASCHTDGSTLDNLKRTLSFHHAKAAELSAKMSTLLDTISQSEKWLETNPGLDPDTLAELRKSTNEARVFVKAMAEQAAKAKTVRAKIDTLEASVRNIETAISAQEDELAGPDILVRPDTPVQELRSALAATEEAIAMRNRLSSNLEAARAVKSSMESRLANIERNIEEAKAKQDNAKGRKEAYETLTAVRDWLHYSNGPHKLAMRVMDELTEDTNKFLSRMDSPFSVQLDPETLGYLFSMNDGSVSSQPADTLSGGQKVVLAVAFRLASYCMFAGKYGLMALDEPTAYLDDNNVSNFCTLLESVKETAASMDLQILVSTHERAVLPYMDSVLDIDAVKA